MFNEQQLDQSDEEEVKKKAKESKENSSEKFVLWNDSTTKLLIAERYEMKKAFDKPKEKVKNIWKKLAIKINKKGYSFTGDQCQSKFSKLETKMRENRKKASEKNTGRSKITWPYYETMIEYFGENYYDDPPVEQLQDTMTEKVMFLIK